MSEKILERHLQLLAVIYIRQSSQQQSVTGVFVNDRLSVPRSTIRQIRAILHNAKHTGLAAQNRDSHPHFRDWLTGVIGWIQMVNPEQGHKLQADLALLKESDS